MVGREVAGLGEVLVRGHFENGEVGHIQAGLKVGFRLEGAD
ncbi:MAG: hypothetical protein QOF84_2762 [Streptomyces sp.]|nr:hypothetical protein [Streptomyces sp.]